SNNTALSGLYCYSNQLSSLDVSNNTALSYLNCGANQLTSLDVRNGNNSTITYFDSDFNPDLTCIFVDDPAYSSANWPYIDPNSTFVANEEECSLGSVAVNTFELGISVYPNPTNNYLFIEGNKNSISFSIYNLLGKKVMSVKNSNRVDVRDLSNGVYTIRISDGVSQTDRKFIKN
ncbi:MAG: T9SS type A sorting domain-containing protein, partial [Bacteroidetes bacterium]|nr:T9SS type A sorting domain-containing protein [Bacteroidota bacterium]